MVRRVDPTWPGPRFDSDQKAIKKKKKKKKKKQYSDVERSVCLCNAAFVQASVRLYPSRHAMSCTVPVMGADSEGQMKVKAVTRDPVPFGSTFLYNTIFSGEWELISVEIQKDGRRGWISLDCSSEMEKSKEKEPDAKSQSPKGKTLIV